MQSDALNLSRCLVFDVKTVRSPERERERERDRLSLPNTGRTRRGGGVGVGGGGGLGGLREEAERRRENPTRYPGKECSDMGLHHSQDTAGT